MKWIVLFLASFSLFSITRLPEEFTVTERFLSLPATFDIETDLEPFAVATKKIFSAATSFDLKDLEGRLLATSESRLLSWITIAHVADPDGQKIGLLEEEYFKIIPWAEYRIFDADDTLKAVAKMNLWGTVFKIYHPDDPTHLYATISRPLIRIYRDCWKVKILDYTIFEQRIIDPRLLVMLAVYQTNSDNRNRLKKEIFDQFRLNQEDFEGKR